MSVNELMSTGAGQLSVTVIILIGVVWGLKTLVWSGMGREKNLMTGMGWPEESKERVETKNR